MQEIEQPLRSSIRDNAEYKAVNEVKAYTTFKKCHNINDLLKIEENLKKVAREVDDLECKIQKVCAIRIIQYRITNAGIV